MVLDAAEQVFVELGYTDASMDDIARRAAMSKKTLYQLFDTKESLFAAVIASRRAELAATVAGIPLGRLGEPEDVAAAVAFLASRQASWISGQTLVVNGGTPV